MQEQNFKNHTRFVPLYHFALWLMLLSIFIGSLINSIQWFNCDANTLKENAKNISNSCLICILTFACIIITWYARAFALKAQDRAIRADEGLRYFIATGKSLPAQLKMNQVIALRFAGDDEWLDLMQKTIEKNLSSKEIKQQIKNWKADNNRV